MTGKISTYIRGDHYEAISSDAPGIVGQGHTEDDAIRDYQSKVTGVNFRVGIRDDFGFTDSVREEHSSAT